MVEVYFDKKLFNRSKDNMLNDYGKSLSDSNIDWVKRELTKKVLSKT
jgi:hypothetical protein